MREPEDITICCCELYFKLTNVILSLSRGVVDWADKSEDSAGMPPLPVKVCVSAPYMISLSHPFQTSNIFSYSLSYRRDGGEKMYNSLFLLPVHPLSEDFLLMVGGTILKMVAE